MAERLRQAERVLERIGAVRIDREPEFGAHNITDGSGSLDVDIAGSGDLVVDGGVATAFKVEIAGSGDVLFKGHAVNPKVEIMGSGSVTVGSYEGNLDKDIAGSGDFKVLGTAGAPPATQQPTPPAPPAH